MSVSLHPSNSLGFKRPLTLVVKRSLTVTNNNAQPIAFKVKTTAPKLYCVRPNSGRVEPGESVEVSVMLQGMKEEPPLNAKCKDKFLIQSTLITPEKETLALNEIWSSPDGGTEAKIYEQKLRVTYLPADGALEEEDENPPAFPVPQNHFAQPMQPNPSILTTGDSRFETSRPHLNGHAEAPAIPSVFMSEPTAPVPRTLTPGQEYSVARESSREAPYASNAGYAPQPSRTPTPPTLRNEPAIAERLPSYAPPAPQQPLPVPAPAPVSAQPSAQSAAPLPIPPPPAPVPVPSPVVVVKESPVNEELVLKLNSAIAEIERLKAALATASVAPPSEVRDLRRRKPMSDDGSVADTDITTVVDDAPYRHHQEGVPLPVVVIVALGVFVTTYLFF